MKRWNIKAIELLKKQSEQSQHGEAITPGNGLEQSRSSTALKISIGWADQPTQSGKPDDGDQARPRLQLRIKLKNRRRR